MLRFYAADRRKRDDRGRSNGELYIGSFSNSAPVRKTLKLYYSNVLQIRSPESGHSVCLSRRARHASRFTSHVTLAYGPMAKGAKPHEVYLWHEERGDGRYWGSYDAAYLL